MHVNNTEKSSQRCESSGCLTCPLLFKFSETIIINSSELHLDTSLTCKDKYVIYVAQCQICKLVPGSEDTYIGQTLTPFHIRVNGHRNKFFIDERKLYEKSALSLHCFLEHDSDQFELPCFKLGIVKRVKPTNLEREESRFCSKFQTNVWGLNRMEITR